MTVLIPTNARSIMRILIRSYQRSWDILLGNNWFFLSCLFLLFWLSTLFAVFALSTMFAMSTLLAWTFSLQGIIWEAWSSKWYMLFSFFAENLSHCSLGILLFMCQTFYWSIFRRFCILLIILEKSFNFCWWYSWYVASFNSIRILLGKFTYIVSLNTLQFQMCLKQNFLKIKVIVPLGTFLSFCHTTCICISGSNSWLLVFRRY